MKYDLLEFIENDTVKKLEQGKLYEFSVHRDNNRKISKVYYILSTLPDGSYKVLMTNNTSDWSDMGAFLSEKSKQIVRPELDMLSSSGKYIRELSPSESKRYVEKNLKTWKIREQFGLPPIKFITMLGHTVEAKFNTC